MIDLAHDVASDEYVRLFRMLSAVNKEAESLHLSTVVHLTNMALLQLSLDWEGVRPENERSAKLSAIFRSKTKLALDEDGSRI
ncbi:hypothetical protein PMI07_001514 [Rhizobium sp. CF080]|uniref:hypothetical protein n=1 Tax=Rhizobium sp. (strain CF080) TaxID=1144310 RepID=UPI00027177AF|nr:hypothetical protein [Rhizobium sp. CF080]EUB96615.1 hypothetical protein PMI07_001514 [Rhizobium sp. CF080]